MRWAGLAGAVLAAAVAAAGAQGSARFVEGADGWTVVGQAGGTGTACMMRTARPEAQGFSYMVDVAERHGLSVGIAYDSTLSPGPVAGVLAFGEGQAVRLEGWVGGDGWTAFKVPRPFHAAVRDGLLSGGQATLSVSRQGTAATTLRVPLAGAQGAFALMSKCVRRVVGADG